MKNYLAIVASLAAAFMLSACVNELDQPIKLGENEIAFVVGGDQVATKATASATVQGSAIELGAVEGEEMFLFESVTNLDDLSYELPQTKGTPIYTENIADFYKGIAATAYENKSGSGVLSDADVWNVDGDLTKTFTVDEALSQSKNAVVYSYNYSTGAAANLQFPNSGLRFFIKAPVTQNGVADLDYYQNGTIKFNFESPTSATAQQDILFTSDVLEKDQHEKNILLYHTLAAVKFKAGIVDDGITTIKKITVKDISSKGSATVVPVNSRTGASNKDGADASKSWKVTTWSNVNTGKDFSLERSELVSAAKGDGNAKFADSFYDGETSKDNINDGNFTYTFNFIPQNVAGKTIEVVFELKINGKTTEYTRTAKFPENTVWEAGKLYTYTLSMNQVDVDITDTVTDNTKSNVVTTNTGNTACYMRAAVVANWVYTDAKGNSTIVAPCTDLIANSDDWKLVGGYYYYKYAVPATQAANTSLLKSNFTAGSTPFSGAHLEMSIALQGVRYDEAQKYVKEAWGNSIVSDAGLSNEIEK